MATAVHPQAPPGHGMQPHGMQVNFYNYGPNYYFSNWNPYYGHPVTPFIYSGFHQVPHPHWPAYIYPAPMQAPQAAAHGSPPAFQPHHFQAAFPFCYGNTGTPGTQRQPPPPPQPDMQAMQAAMHHIAQQWMQQYPAHPVPAAGTQTARAPFQNVPVDEELTARPPSEHTASAASTKQRVSRPPSHVSATPSVARPPSAVPSAHHSPSGLRTPSIQRARSNSPRVSLSAVANPGRALSTPSTHQPLTQLEQLSTFTRLVRSYRNYRSNGLTLFLDVAYSKGSWWRHAARELRSMERDWRDGFTVGAEELSPWFRRLFNQVLESPDFCQALAPIFVQHGKRGRWVVVRLEPGRHESVSIYDPTGKADSGRVLSVEAGEQIDLISAAVKLLYLHSRGKHSRGPPLFGGTNQEFFDREPPIAWLTKHPIVRGPEKEVACWIACIVVWLAIVVPLDDKTLLLASEATLPDRFHNLLTQSKEGAETAMDGFFTAVNDAYDPPPPEQTARRRFPLPQFKRK